MHWLRIELNRVERNLNSKLWKERAKPRIGNESTESWNGNSKEVECEAVSCDGNFIVVDLWAVVILLRSGTERNIMLKFVSRLTSRRTRIEDAKRKESNWMELVQSREELLWSCAAIKVENLWECHNRWTKVEVGRESNWIEWMAILVWGVMLNCMETLSVKVGRSEKVCVSCVMEILLAKVGERPMVRGTLERSKRNTLSGPKGIHWKGS